MSGMPLQNPSPGRPRFVSFANFRLDLLTQELRRNGVRVRLQSKPFLVLEFLLERDGDIVSRDELKQRLWPGDTHVSFETGLNTAVTRLRQALGDTADNPRFVETLSRRGYRFISPVQWSDAAEGSSSPAPAMAVTPRPSAVRSVAMTAAIILLLLVLFMITWPLHGATARTLGHHASAPPSAPAQLSTPAH